uniref:Uncharacterized protein n=1 Tax=Arundo donax TaxID=35708 RepID=A0A0A9PX59_ARUDO
MNDIFRENGSMQFLILHWCSKEDLRWKFLKFSKVH